MRIILKIFTVLILSFESGQVFAQRMNQLEKDIARYSIIQDRAQFLLKNAKQVKDKGMADKLSNVIRRADEKRREAVSELEALRKKMKK